MRIRAERDDLADVLARAGRAVGTRSPLPILQGIRCEVDTRCHRDSRLDHAEWLACARYVSTRYAVGARSGTP